VIVSVRAKGESVNLVDDVSIIIVENAFPEGNAALLDRGTRETISTLELRRQSD